MGINGVKPLMDIGDAMGVGGVFGFLQKLGPLRGRGQYGFEWRGRTARRLLGDIADREIRRPFDLAIVGFIDPGNELQERGLSRAVAADQPHARLWRQRRGSMVEDEMAAKAQRNGIECEHGRRDSTGISGSARLAIGVSLRQACRA